MQVRLTSEEFEYLLKCTFLGQAERSLLMKATRTGENYLVDVSVEEADSIRDACGEQLQRAGFDEKYAATTEGAILERLIDKFFGG
jgi:hypothetical protein